MQVSVYDFFHLSLSPIFEYFQTDEEGRQFVVEVNPSRVKDECNRLATMANTLANQLPVAASQILQTLEDNQVEAVEQTFRKCPSSPLHYVLSPKGEEQVGQFRAKFNDGAFNSLFGNTTLDTRIVRLLERVCLFAWNPSERKTCISQRELVIAHILGLDKYFNIQDKVEVSSFTATHTYYRRCHPLSDHLGKTLHHSDVNCWCRTVNNHLCFSVAMSKIRFILNYSQRCQWLSDRDKSENEAITLSNRTPVSIWDKVPFYEMDRAKYSEKSELTDYVKLLHEVRRIYQELSANVTLEEIEAAVRVIIVLMISTYIYRKQTFTPWKRVSAFAGVFMVFSMLFWLFRLLRRILTLTPHRASNRGLSTKIFFLDPVLMKLVSKIINSHTC
jgi:hypothetical protein